MKVTEFAPAKINLALHVTGQRSDGYHLLDSLVGFASIGDRITIERSDELSLTVTGTLSDNVPTGSDNLVCRAAKWFGEGRGAKITLEKHLPAAAGIGGASADAGAVLRALAKLWDRPLPSPEQTLFLGADVPMCLVARPCHVQGIGEKIMPVATLWNLPIVLVNPRVSVSTPQVFARLPSRENTGLFGDVNFATADDLIAFLGNQRNDMQSAAVKIAPEIDNVLGALGETTAEIVRMSGSGATCFAIYSGEDSATSAANHIAQTHPNWWVAQGRLN